MFGGRGLTDFLGGGGGAGGIPSDGDDDGNKGTRENGGPDKKGDAE